MSPHSLPTSSLSRRGFLLGSALLGGSAALAACSAAGPGPTTARSVPTGPNAFKGVTVRVAVGSFMSTGVKIFKDAWEKETGGRLDVVEIPFGDLYSKLFQAFSSRVDAYDVLIYAGGWVSGFAKAGYISSLEDYYVKYKDNADAVLPRVRQLSTYDSKRYTVPLDGDVIMLYYRKDAFENPEGKKRFKSQTGKDLAVPETWADYVEAAKFFTGWDWAGNGKPCYGVLEAMKPKDVGPYIFTAHAAGYAAHPDSPGSLFFDPKTMKPQVGNPGWVQALEDWKALKASGPSQMVTYGGGDQRSNFVAGNYALGIDWPDIGILAQDPQQSTVKDKLGYAIIPGSKRVWSVTNNRWDEGSEVRRTPYLGWGGWHASVAATSPNQAAAWHFANFLDTTTNARTAVTTPGTARGPYRTDHFEPSLWSNSAVKFANPQTYLDAQKQSFEHPNAQFDLRIPEAGRYFEALDQAVQLAMSGSKTSTAAMEQCASDWATITDQIGKDSQQKLYQQLQVMA